MALLSVTGGACLLSLAFIVDWVGISAPGFGPLQALMVVVGGGGVLLGGSLSLPSGPRVQEFIEETLILLRRSLQAGWPDLCGALVLYCVGLIVGALYVYTVKQSGAGGFYSATVDQYRYVPVRVFTDAVYPYGVLFGAVVALAYGIFRIGMGRALSTLGALALMSSPIHLFNLVPSIGRAYSKAPFVLAVVLIMGLLVSSPWNRHRLLGLSTVGGIIVGLGVWVREDLMLFVLPFTVMLFFFLPGPVLANIKIKAAALVLFAAPFLFIAAPVLTQSASRGMQPVVGGFMSPMDDRLGVTRPIYDWGHLLLDEYMYDISYAQTKARSDYDHEKSGNDRARVGFDYVFKIVRNFPADTLIRTYAAILKVLDFPFTYMEPPLGITNHFTVAIYSWRATVLSVLAGAGLFLCVATLLMTSAYSLRKAIFCLCFLVYFAGYPVLQFLGKHYFYLEFIAWWTLGFVIQHSLLFLGQWGHQGSPLRSATAWLALLDPRRWWPVPGKRVVVFALGSLMTLLLPVLVLRQYQAGHVGHLLHELANANAESLPLARLPIGRQAVLITNPEQFEPVPHQMFSVEYLVAEFSAEQCGYSTVWPIFRYGPNSVPGRPDYSRSMSVNLADSGTMITRVFFPAISSEHSTYKGIELLREQENCLRGVSRIQDPIRFPILLTVQLPPSGVQAPLYQTLAAWEANNIYTVPANMPRAMVKGLLERSLSPLTLGDVAFHADIVHIGAEQWIVKGYATPQADPYDNPISDRSHSVLARESFADVNVAKIDTDLVLTKETALPKGSYFIAQGVLYAGGVTFGLIKDGRTAGYVNVTNRGPFTVVIEVPEGGLYSLGVANNLDGYTSLENRFVVTRSGWVKDQSMARFSVYPEDVLSHGSRFTSD